MINGLAKCIEHHVQRDSKRAKCITGGMETDHPTLGLEWNLNSVLQECIRYLCCLRRCVIPLEWKPTIAGDKEGTKQRQRQQRENNNQKRKKIEN
ncbi:hypothetical protein ACLOJK_005330 [Asimina triloba]